MNNLFRFPGLGLRGLNRQSQAPTRPTVAAIDITRYMGTWYEIARFNHVFERDLEKVTARYTLQENGRVEVVNSGYKNRSGRRFSSITGRAYQPDSQNHPGWLKVSFFLNFYSDYYILDLDVTSYEYALVGSKKKSYLWILSRQPEISEALRDQILVKAQILGYDTQKLIWVDQK